MVESMYHEMTLDVKHRIQQLRWVNVVFDESTTKTKARSFVGIAVTYYNAEIHWSQTDFIKLHCVNASDAKTLAESIKQTIIDE